MLMSGKSCFYWQRSVPIPFHAKYPLQAFSSIESFNRSFCEMPMPGIFDEFPRYIIQPFSILVSSQEKQEITGYFSFPYEFSGFEGHFPGNPLLPGVVQISLARFTAIQGGSDVIQHIKRCKFICSIKPQEKITVMVHQSGSHHFQAEVSANNQICSLLTFSLQPQRNKHEALSLV
ncbi:hypothetical protein CI789_12900 [Erwinia persicina]|nr:hypothetical protein CI789_12900 [Erwinia persicina]